MAVKTLGQNRDDVLLSVVENLFEIKNTRSLEKIIGGIRGTYFKEKIEKIRNSNNKDERNLLKKDLLSFTPAGNFSEKRRAETLIEYSGIIGLDFDNLKSEQVAEAVMKITSSAYTYGSFISPSGNGIKVFVQTNASIDQHTETYIEVQTLYEEMLGIKADPACKDLARLCFFSYDPDAYYNVNSKIYEVLDSDKPNDEVQEKKDIQVSKVGPLVAEEEDEEMVEVVDFTNNVTKYQEGNRNNYIFLLASNCNKRGIVKGKAVEYVKSKFDLPATEILTAFNSAYSKVAEFAKFAIANKNDELLNMPFFPDEIFDLLPTVLKPPKSLIDKRQRDVYFLAAMTVFSGGLKKVSGIYNYQLLSPNLFTLIVAPAASGKGVMLKSKDFGMGYHQDLIIKSKELLENYYVELELYKASKKTKGGSVLNMPIKPLNKTFYIPANSSQAKFLEFLTANEGTGVVLDTEADVLSGISKQDWGINSTNLRAGFHNETISISRKGDGLHHEINAPKFSICLSGTPDQVPKLLESADNGLFSRFIFYSYRAEMRWKDPSSQSNMHSYNNRRDLLGKVGKIILEHFEKNDVEIKLTKLQWDRHNSFFSELLTETKIHSGENASSIIFRFGVIAFKIYMNLSALRNGYKPIQKGELIVEDVDIEIGLKIVKTSIEHSFLVYNSMPKKDSFFFKTSGSSTKNLLSELPKEFSRKDAVDLGTMKFKLSQKTVDNFLKLATSENVLEKLKSGSYKKNVAA